MRFRCADADWRRGPGLAGYDENWLQRLLFETPEVLPIGEIDPAFTSAVPLCRELPTIEAADSCSGK